MSSSGRCSNPSPVPPAAEAARQGFHDVIGTVGHNKPFHHLRDATPQFRPTKAVEVTVVHEILTNGQLLIETWTLKHDADSTTHLVCMAFHVRTEYAGFAGGRRK